VIFTLKAPPKPLAQGVAPASFGMGGPERGDRLQFGTQRTSSIAAGMSRGATKRKRGLSGLFAPAAGR